MRILKDVNSADDLYLSYARSFANKDCAGIAKRFGVSIALRSPWFRFEAGVR